MRAPSSALLPDRNTPAKAEGKGGVRQQQNEGRTRAERGRPERPPGATCGRRCRWRCRRSSRRRRSPDRARRRARCCSAACSADSTWPRPPHNHGHLLCPAPRVGWCCDRKGGERCVLGRVGRAGNGGRFGTSPAMHRSRSRIRRGRPCVPRNSKSGHQLIQNNWAGILSLSPG